MRLHAGCSFTDRSEIATPTVFQLQPRPEPVWDLPRVLGWTGIASGTRVVHVWRPRPDGDRTIADRGTERGPLYT